MWPDSPADPADEPDDLPDDLADLPDDLDDWGLAPEDFPPYEEAAVIEEDRMIRQMFREDYR